MGSSSRARSITRLLTDTPEREKLLAARMDVAAMRDYIQADSLAFITIDGLYQAMGEARDAGAPQRCDACFTGAYPTRLTDHPAGASDVAQEQAMEESFPVAANQ